MTSWKNALGAALALTAAVQLLFDLALGSWLRHGSSSDGELLVEMAVWVVVLVVLVLVGRRERRQPRSEDQEPRAPRPRPSALAQTGLTIGVLAFIGLVAVGQLSGGVVGGALGISNPQRTHADHVLTASGRKSSTTFVTFTDLKGVTHRSAHLITEGALHDVSSLSDDVSLVYDRDQPTKVMTAGEFDSARYGRDALLHWGSMVGMLLLFVVSFRRAGRRR